MARRPTKWLLLLLFIFCQIHSVQALEGDFFQKQVDASTEIIVPGTIIFKMKPGAVPYIKSTGIEIESFEKALQTIEANTPARIFPAHRTPALKTHRSGQPLVDLSLIFEIKIKDPALLEDAIQALYATGLVEYAQPRYLPTLFYVPNDPMVGNQYYLSRIKAYDAWEISRGDTNIVIGIVDTGIDLNHPDLIHAIKYNHNDPINGVDNDNDGFTDNFHGWDLGENDNNPQYNFNAHGVHVAGIAAAKADNGTGISGTGFLSKLLPIKVDDELGRLVMAYEGIVYAADQGAQVINCSWGGALGAGQFGQDIVNYAALNRDVVVIAAAGNANNQVPLFPASYDNVMSVAASNINDHKWSGSSYGIYVDVSAPGENMLSTWPNGTYIPGNGTSMAAPVVAGAAGILRHHFPDYSSSQIVAQLKVTADDIDTIPANLEYQGLLGTGRINLYRALSETHHPYIRLTGHVMPTKELALLEPGVNFELASYFQNLLAPTGNITATLSSSSPHVQISQPEVALGAIGTFEVVTNTSNPFRVSLMPTLPASHSVVFTITFTNQLGEYAGRQRFSILFNVDYVNVHVNDISTTITSRGTIGYNYPNYNQGQGLIYKDGLSSVRSAGLVIGASSSKVVDNIYGATEGSFNNFFVAQQNARVMEEPSFGDVQVAGIFTDALAGTFALDVQVDYSVSFWQENPHRKYMIMEYHITNKSATSYSSLYAGFFADWVLRDNKNHRAAYDADHRLGYAFSATGGFYTGISLLSQGGLRHYAFDNTGFGGSIKISDGFTGFEKYTALRTNRNNAGVFDEDNEISTLMSSGPYFLGANETITIAFALLAGDHLADLRASAQAAQNKYLGLDGSTSSIDIPGKPQEWLKIYPQPVGSSMTIGINVPLSGNLVLSITDLMGRVIQWQVLPVQAGLLTELKVNTSDLRSGQYIINLSGQGFSRSMTFIRL